METYKMYIGGKAVQADGTLDVINPSTGEAFAKVQNGSPSHVDAAVEAARAAFPAWSAKPAAERKALMHALAAAIEANTPELMKLVTLESGKPMGGLNGVGSGMEVGGSAGWTHFTAELELPVDVIQDNDQARIEVHRKPLGVVGSITPWNWPLLISIWHIMPAMIAGNTVVLKPSILTPVAVTRFVELANAILPPGVLNIVTGGSSLGAAITNHSGVNKIVFTGSTPTGRKIMEAAAGNLKHLTLELGGNDAAIVLPDVNVKEVAPKLFGFGFHNNGQTCACLKRLYVHESIYDEMCNELARLAKEAIVGDASAPDTQLGPLQNKAQMDFVRELSDDAKANGGRILAGGKAKAGKGYFFEPTIVAGLSNGSRLVDEEQFGPILPVIKYKDVEEAIRLANDNPNGLGGSIWSNDKAKATKLAGRLECGTAWVNSHGAIQPDAPFGGVKQSGIGVEFGLYGLEEYTSIQTVMTMKN